MTFQFNQESQNQKTQENQAEEQQEQPQEENQNQSQNQSQQQENQTAEQAHSSDSEPDWDSAPLPEESELNAEAVEMPTGGIDNKFLLNSPQGAKYVLDYDTFHSGFVKAFQLAGHTTQLQTLIAVGDNPTSPPATRAIYDIILETPFLHFIISPKSIWLQRTVAIGAFFIPLGFSCAAELKMKVEAAKAEQEQGATA